MGAVSKNAFQIRACTIFFLLWFLESPVEARAAQCANRILLYSISRMEGYVDNSESGRVDWF
jgi:hypothetical protein